MNPNASRVVLRPRGAFEVFDLTWCFLRVRWRPIASLAALLIGPMWLLCCLGLWLTDGHAAWLLVPLLAALPLQAPFTILTGRLLFSDEVSLPDVLRDCLSLGPALLAAWCVRLAGWSASAVTCFVGLPVVESWVAYVTEAALLERVGPGRGVRRSLRLSSKNPMIGLMAGNAMWLLAVYCAVSFEMTGVFLTDTVLQLGSPFGRAQYLVVTPWLLLGLFVSQPLAAIYRLFLYVDARTRAEGWDLQVTLRAAGLTA